MLGYVVVPGALLLQSDVGSLFVVPRPPRVVPNGLNNFIGLLELKKTEQL